MMDVGRICVKLAGRDAGMKCAIVDILDKNNVLIDGQTRRRKCNIKHLEPLAETVKIKKGASHDEIKKAFKALNLEIKDSKPKKATTRPRKTKLQKKSKESKDVKKTEKAEKKGTKTKKSEEKTENKASASKESNNAKAKKK